MNVMHETVAEARAASQNDDNVHLCETKEGLTFMFERGQRYPRVVSRPRVAVADGLITDPVE